MSEKRHVVYPYNKRTVEQKGRWRKNVRVAGLGFLVGFRSLHYLVLFPGRNTSAIKHIRFDINVGTAQIPNWLYCLAA
ncbi:MAG: hypothetical protein ACUVT5_00120 [Candidatus Bathyarchaeales archaeon]